MGVAIGSSPTHNGADSVPGVCTCIKHSSRTVVEAVQLSGQVTSFQVPSEIIASIVKVCPGFITPMVLFAQAVAVGEGCQCEELGHGCCTRTVCVCLMDALLKCGTDGVQWNRLHM